MKATKRGNKQSKHDIDGVVVGTSASTSQNNLLSGAKRVVMVLCLLTVLSVVLLGGYKYYHQAHEKNQCSATLLSQSSRAMLGSTPATSLKPLVGQILATAHYDKDQNCLYVVTYYYLVLGDPQNAQVYFNKLTKVYDAKTSYSSQLNPVLSNKTLQNNINFLNNQASAARANLFYGGTVHD